MDTDRMKIINPKTNTPEYVVGENNQVEDVNQSRIEADRLKNVKGTSDEPSKTN